MDGGDLTSTSGYGLTGLLDAQGTASSSTLAQARLSLSKEIARTWTYGTGSGQINTLICQERTLNASASEELDLNAGTLKDIFGAAAVLTNVKFVFITPLANPDASTASSGATIGNAAANGHQLWFGADTDTYALSGHAAGGVPFQQGDAAGKTVDASNKLVKVANADGSNKFTYQLVIGGVA